MSATALGGKTAHTKAVIAAAPLYASRVVQMLIFTAKGHVGVAAVPRIEIKRQVFAVICHIATGCRYNRRAASAVSP